MTRLAFQVQEENGYVDLFNMPPYVEFFFLNHHYFNGCQVSFHHKIFETIIMPKLSKALTIFFISQLNSHYA